MRLLPWQSWWGPPGEYLWSSRCLVWPIQGLLVNMIHTCSMWNLNEREELEAESENHTQSVSFSDESFSQMSRYVPLVIRYITEVALDHMLLYSWLNSLSDISQVLRALRNKYIGHHIGRSFHKMALINSFVFKFFLVHNKALFFTMLKKT